MDYKAYFQTHRDQHLNELKEWLSIPSISALSEHKPDVKRAAEWLAETLQKAGLENVKIHETNGHPIVYADHLHAPGQPTVLVYGHYDVQPVDPLNLWDTPPFEPAERDGKLYARGATDDKGQIFLHIKAVEAILQQEKQLPVNIKFCVEGEEEVGSPNLPFSRSVVRGSSCPNGQYRSALRQLRRRRTECAACDGQPARFPA